MSRFLRSIARLALGTGPALEPLLRSDFESARETDPDEVEVGSGPAPAPAERIVERRATERASSVQPIQVTSHQRSVHHHDERSATYVDRIEHSSVHVSNPPGVVERTVETRHERSEVRERRETLRELVREAAAIHRERLVQGVEAAERTVPAPAARAIDPPRGAAPRPREIEVARPRPIAVAPTSIGADPGPDIRIEPSIEISIGRIEIKAERPAPTASRDPEAKPSGILALNDYLRERSRGSL